MICPPCRRAADFSAALARGFAAEIVEGAVGHEPEVCRDHATQPAGCASSTGPCTRPRSPESPVSDHTHPGSHPAPSRPPADDTAPREVCVALAERMFDDAHENCDEGCHGTPRSYYDQYAEALLEETILPLLRPEIERRERNRAADELFQRFQRMREEGEHDMRTVLHHVRDVLRGGA